MFSNIRASIAATVAAVLVFGASPAGAVDPDGLGGFKGPITTWLARAPAGCVINSYLRDGRDFPDSNHVAYWVGHAMDGDEHLMDTFLSKRASWRGMLDGGTEAVGALYDPLTHVAAFGIGHQDMNEEGLLAAEPDPPASAPQMRADLSKIALGGNVHLGDSLATVSGALGLHALAPTDIAACPGFGVVELCDWNVAGCSCPPTMFYQGSKDISGIIIFRNRRVVGLIWNEKCWAAG